MKGWDSMLESIRCMIEEFDKSIINTLKLTKVFVTDKFKNATVLERSMMIKEKEFEINHE